MKTFNRLQQIEYTPHDKKRIFVDEKPAEDEERGEFERDRARIVHSSAFRRLQGKTQVFALGESDFFRTRLTHSIEVAQIGKGLALRLGANTDLVEAICLVHDIGHPPFGHAGEDALKEAMEPFGGFEANAQNVRLLTELESKSDDYKGLNLTRATIDGQMKYKLAFPHDKRKFIYRADLDTMHWASKDAQSSIRDSRTKWKSFECEIMDWADEVAYAVHDLEDSIHARVIDGATFSDEFPADDAMSDVRQKYGLSLARVESIWEDLVKECQLVDRDLKQPRRKNTETQKKANRKKLTSFLIGRYIKSTDRKERELIDGDISSYRYKYRLKVPIEHRVEVALINELILKFVIGIPQNRALEENGKYIVRNIFSMFMSDNRAMYLLPKDFQERLSECDGDWYRARVVCDYISGMTDGFAQRTYARLFLPNQGSVYDLL